MSRHPNAVVSGRVGRFIAPNKVIGWVLVSENEKPVTVQVKYREELIGSGFADQIKDFIEQKTGRRRFGFIVKLSRALSDFEVYSDDFQIYAEIGAVSLKLKKSNKLRPEEHPSKQVNEEIEFDDHPLSKVEVSEILVKVGTRSENGAAVIGRSGFIFLIGGSNNVEDMYNGFDDGESIRWSELVSSRMSFCKQRDVGFLQIFIPEKQSVLSKYYDDPISVPSPVYKNVKAQIQDSYLSKNVLFYEDLLGNGLLPEDAFKKTDSHLTSEGAQALFDETVRKLTNQFLSYEITGFQEMVLKCDLSKKFQSINILEKVKRYYGLKIANTEMTATLLREELPTSGHLGTKRIYINEFAPIKKKLVAFANSFFWGSGKSYGLCWWYSRLFSEFHFVWSPEMKQDYIKENKPDIVICQTIERFLRRVPSS